jgi:RHH-type proline utilization regulon transcriptional repressor/proline dehydrogenase/delta 1-pyrroline-5-carboxylate dehydrogenase
LEGELERVRGRSLSELELEASTAAIARALLERENALRTPAEHKRHQLLARLMNDEAGQTLTTCLTDRVYRSRNPELIVDTARQLLRALGVPRYLPAEARAQLQLFLRAGPFLPQLAAQSMLRRLRSETRDVVLSSEESELHAHLAKRRREGTHVNLNYLGEAVLGEREAAARCQSYEALLARPDVEAISVKLSSIISRSELLALRDTIETLKPRLRRIYRAALAHRFKRRDGSMRPKLVNLDMEAYADLHLTFQLFTELLDEPELLELQAGMVLQAYLPDSFEFQRELTRWAAARVARGGAPSRLRIVKGANLAAELVESSIRGWPSPIFEHKVQVDANYKRMLELGCQPEHAGVVHLGVASHNLFDVAFALCQREMRGLAAELSFEVLEGMADPLRRALQTVSDDVLVYCPIVAPESMQTAIAYLTRRLDENTGAENFLRHGFGMQVGDAAFERERARFAEALALRGSLPSAPRRKQDRALPPPPVCRGPGASFDNEPDTDFALPQNQRFIADVLERWRTRPCFEVAMTIAGERTSAGTLRDGFDPSRPQHVPYRHPLADAAPRARARAAAAAAAPRFAALPPKERAALLQHVAQGLRAARGELIAAMLLDAGKRVDQADAEVSEAIDFAEYYAHTYCEHARRPELRLHPSGVVLVTPPWNFPLAIPAGGTLAALVAGNAVILKPALETVLVAERLAELCYEAGVPRDVLQLVFCEDELGSRLIQDARVSQVVLTGATSTARKFLELRPELRLLAETGGKNSVIVSALADRDAAIKDTLASAFGHAGQKCSAASLLICVPDVYDDPSFIEVLRDATESLPVGSAWDMRSVVTPLIRPPSGPLARALTTLDADERWLVEPRIDSDNPRLVSPGVKLDVAANSFSHTTELFGPVLSVMRAESFEHAIELANGTSYGLTAGLFTLDEREQKQWAERMQAGNLYVNRGTTGAIVRRQPFGGWKGSSFGPGAKAGGPNYVLQLCERSDSGEELPVEAPEPMAAELLGIVRSHVDKAAKERLARAACQYAHALHGHFRLEHDPSELLGEQNIFRYLPHPALMIRAAADAELESVLRACLAAISVGARPELSLHPSFAGTALFHKLALPGCAVHVQDAAAAAARLRERAVSRVRQVGTIERALRAAAAERGGHIAAEPVLAAGRVELLHYVREQALSNAYHRYGSLHAAALLERAH